MRKIICLILTLFMVLSLFVSCNDTADEPQNTTENMTEKTTESTTMDLDSNSASDFEYEINSDKTGILINKYVGSSVNVVIPSYIENLPVVSIKGLPDETYPTAIATGTFEGSNIRTVLIPETVKGIGARAFKDCGELTTVTISPNSNLTQINGRAFEKCVKLEKIDFSKTQLKKIGTLAFSGCIALKEVIFSDTLESIKERAFYECSALLEVDFPESLTIIEGGGFAYCTSLKYIEFPTKLDLTSLGESIFHDVPALERVVFKEGREDITGYALIQTDASIEVVVPKTVMRFSPLPFLVPSSTNIKINFLGNAPEIVEYNDPDWFENATIYYDSETTGWETFIWKDKLEIKTIN